MLLLLLSLVSLSSELVLNNPPRETEEALRHPGFSGPLSCPQTEEGPLLTVPVWPPANTSIGERRVQVAILPNI